MKTKLVMALWLAGTAGAQDPSLQPLVDEAARLRQLPAPHEDTFWKDLGIYRERSTNLHILLRDWIESLLPKSRSVLDSELPLVQARVNAALWRSGLLLPGDNGDQDFKPGFIGNVELSKAAGDPDKVLVVAGLDMPCGQDDNAYVYDYSQGIAKRVLESRPSRDHDETVSHVQFSGRDAAGSESILVLRFPIQCGSTWSMLSYDLFRQPGSGLPASRVLSDEREIKDWDYQTRLKPDDLLIELSGRSIDVSILIRTHVLHYNGYGQRIDPVALLPQDFVDEWLSRPWTEMESQSAETGREKLKQWHEFLAGDFVAGDFSVVHTCQQKPGHWEIGIDLDRIQAKELPEPLSAYFMVQQTGPYAFTMTQVSFDGWDEACPGEGEPRRDPSLPSLFPPPRKDR